MSSLSLSLIQFDLFHNLWLLLGPIDVVFGWLAHNHEGSLLLLVLFDGLKDLSRLLSIKEFVVFIWKEFGLRGLALASLLLPECRGRLPLLVPVFLGDLLLDVQFRLLGLGVVQAGSEERVNGGPSRGGVRRAIFLEVRQIQQA